MRRQWVSLQELNLVVCVRNKTVLYSWPLYLKSVPLMCWTSLNTQTHAKNCFSFWMTGSSQGTNGRPHIGANGVSWPPGKMDEKLKSENMQKRAVFYVCYILRAMRTGRCRERPYADSLLIQIYFRVHHFVVKFSNLSSPQAARGHWPP